MTKLKINRTFAYIFIILSFVKVVFSLIFVHSVDLGENIIHYIENIVHIILLIFLCKQVIKNKIGHFFHEYFLEAIIMGLISSISIVYNHIMHDFSFNGNLLTVFISLLVNIFLLISFEHHHDRTVKTVLIIFVAVSLAASIYSIFGNISSYNQGKIIFELFMISLTTNLLTMFFNVFVLLTAISMHHVLRKDQSRIVHYVKLEENEK